MIKVDLVLVLVDTLAQPKSTLVHVTNQVSIAKNFKINFEEKKNLDHWNGDENSSNFSCHNFWD
jgi:hypothetical protein